MGTRGDRTAGEVSDSLYLVYKTSTYLRERPNKRRRGRALILLNGKPNSQITFIAKRERYVLPREIHRSLPGQSRTSESRDEETVERHVKQKRATNRGYNRGGGGLQNFAAIGFSSRALPRAARFIKNRSPVLIASVNASLAASRRQWFLLNLPVALASIAQRVSQLHPAATLPRCRPFTHAVSPLFTRGPPAPPPPSNFFIRGFTLIRCLYRRDLSARSWLP